MKILVAYANRHGATRGIGERIAERLKQSGLDVRLLHADAAERLGQYDGFVVGGATYMHHWLNEAASFVRHHQMLLAERPVWLYSSEPIRSPSASGQGWEAPGECPAPREFGEFAETIRPRDARVFPGACDPDSRFAGFGARLGARLRIPVMSAGQAKAAGPGGGCAAIEAWADDIARALGAGPALVKAAGLAGTLDESDLDSASGRHRSSDGPASAITRAASKQTYYTIRFLVDRPRMADAYRAYAYFRWIDDVLDGEATLGSVWSEADRIKSMRFLDRQKLLLNGCLRGEPPRDASRQEAMLLELVRNADASGAGVEIYLRHMMRVMDFDLRRRGRLVTEGELSNYTQWLAIAVTEAMHHFIGNGVGPPNDPRRYMAVSGAHILHMLRDTYVDLRAGYWNIPGEVLERHSIGPEDVHSDAYRQWVEARVRLASTYFEDGKAYLARVGNVRHRLAGLAYIARFEWLIEMLKRDDFRLRPDYARGGGLAMGLRGSWRLVSSMGVAARPIAEPALSDRVRGGGR